MVSLFATTDPGSKAGPGIVFSPSMDEWNDAPVYCIQISEGAEVGCKDVYDMAAMFTPMTIFSMVGRPVDHQAVYKLTSHSISFE